MLNLTAVVILPCDKIITIVILIIAAVVLSRYTGVKTAEDSHHTWRQIQSDADAGATHQIITDEQHKNEAFPLVKCTQLYV